MLCELPTGKKLVITIELQDAIPAPNPTDPATPPPTDPTTPTEPAPGGFDLGTNGMLLECYNQRLIPSGDPERALLSSLGTPFGYTSGEIVAHLEFDRFNSCYQWSGAIRAMEDGEHEFAFEVKSAGFVLFDGEIVFDEPREQDTGSHAFFAVAFKATLEKGKLYPLRCLMVKQSGEHRFVCRWRPPSRIAQEPVAIPLLACHPPANWQTRLKEYVPPPPPPPIFAQPNWSTYVSPPVDVQVFPEDNPWNQRVDHLPVDPLSDKIIAALGDIRLHPVFGQNGVGLPYMVVSSNTPLVPITFDYQAESDPGPYPIPDLPVLEGGGGDGHLLILQPETMMLYELFSLRKENGAWRGGSGAIWNLTQNQVRPLGWTSADAAGLAMFPGLVRWDEATTGAINHAIRISLPKTRRAFVRPASHWASVETGEEFLPMGARMRLKGSVDVSGAPPLVRPILETLKTHGAMNADNGGPFIGLCGAPDSRWNDDELAWMKQLTAQDFEVVQMGEIITEVP